MGDKSLCGLCILPLWHIGGSLGESSFSAGDGRAGGGDPVIVGNWVVSLGS